MAINDCKPRSIIYQQISAFCLICIASYIFWGTFIDGVYVGRIIQYWPGCFTTNKLIYKSGDNLKIRLVATKYRNIPGKITWSIENVSTKEVIHFAVRDTILKMGYNDKYTTIGRIPHSITTGWWRAIGYAVYPINALKNIVYTHTDTELFWVIGNNDPYADDRDIDLR